MLKIMVVDDEMLLRLAIKNLMNWEEYGYQMIEDTSSGETAIEIIRENTPDILITDVKMPRMDGVELIKYIEQYYPRIRIIVLSGYSDFDIVKSALLHGADDYILKPDITPEGLLNIVNKVRDKHFKNENSSKEKRVKENEVEKNFLHLRNEFLRELVLGKLDGSDEIEKQNILYKAGLLKGKYILCTIKFDNIHEISSLYDNHDRKMLKGTALNIIKEIFSFKGAYFSVEYDEYVCLIYMNGYSEKEFLSSIYDFTGKLSSGLSRYVNISVSIGLSKITGGRDEIARAYGQCTKAIEYRFYTGGGKVHNYMENAFMDEDISKQWHKFRNTRLLKEQLEKENWNWISEYFAKVTGEFEQKRYPPDFVRKAIADILLIIQSLLIEMVDNPWENAYSNEIIFNRVMGMETVQAMNEFIKEYLSYINAYLQKAKNEKYSNIVSKAIENIVNDYDKEISLVSISEKINVNSSYLSRLFLNETGKNFVDYLTDIRMEKARKYLERGKFQIQEVSEMVGYKSPKYFNRVFKSKTGVSPCHYKETM